MKKSALGVVVVLLLGMWWYRGRSDRPNQETPGNTTQQTTQTVVTNTPITVKVQQGEGLWQIAARELGSGEKWTQIAKENNLTKKPYTLYIGQELKIPGKVVETVSQATNKYTLAHIAEHGTKDSCWMALEGNVYDVTDFVSSGFHPGKAAILAGCGIDATELFNTRPMGSGTSHSERARKMLPKYLIGELAQ